MKASGLRTLLVRDFLRSRGALATSMFGLCASSAALVFFGALGLGVSDVLLGEVFPVDRVELEPNPGPEPSLLSALLGGTKRRIVPNAAIEALSGSPNVKKVFPRARFAFPAGAFGGREILGRDFGAHEILAEGVPSALLAADVVGPNKFEDPLLSGEKRACKSDVECNASDREYCELPSSAERGTCSKPVPVMVSKHLIELFNKGLAPAHGLPPVGVALITTAQGVVFDLELGVGVLGRAKFGQNRRVKARVVGVSSYALDIGLTVPLEVAQRWNLEYAGENGAGWTSALVVVDNARHVADVTAIGAKYDLGPKDTRARDVSVLVHACVGLLMLVPVAIGAVAMSNIAFTFRVLIEERRREIGLYRALGATPGDIRQWITVLSMLVGTLGGTVGIGLAWIAAIAVNSLAASYLPDFPYKPTTFFRFEPAMLAVTVFASCLLSVVAASASVRRAASIDPSRVLAES